VVLITPFVTCADEEDTRDQKLISTFQIVRFPNDPCVGSNARNGTCYTSQECSDKSGTSAGSCADGFGVCCTFIITTCGSTSSENLTHWTQPSTVSSGSCALTVCPIDDSICSLRLDFTKFEITGPSTVSVAQVRRQLGHPTQNLADATYATGGSSMATSCLVDSFYMKGASTSSNPPAICGTATGEHMYVEADVDACNHLVFQLADAATPIITTGTTPSNSRGVASLATRAWDMKVTQIECSSKTLPPVGCTKYYWNTNAGRALLTSSNWQVTTTSIHLGNQHDRYCIRRERGYCVGCFAAADSEFAVSGRIGIGANAVNYVTPGGCCGYTTQGGLEDVATPANNVADGTGKAGDGSSSTVGLTQIGWDCIIIPGAFMSIQRTAIDGAVKTTQTTANIQQVLSESPTTDVINAGSGPQICGNNKGIGAGILNTKLGLMHDKTNALLSGAGIIANYSVCTRSTPFIMEFMSDDLEGLGGNNGGTNAGISECSKAGGCSGHNKGFHITHEQLTC